MPADAPTPEAVILHTEDGSSSPWEPVSLRAFLSAVLPTDSDFNLFCTLWFSAVQKRLASGMDRVQALSLLLAYHSPVELITAVQRHEPGTFARHLPQLRPRTPLGTPPHEERRGQVRRMLERVFSSLPEACSWGASHYKPLAPLLQQAPDLSVCLDLLSASVPADALAASLGRSFPDRTVQGEATQGAALCATLRLDRKSQWQKLEAACSRPECAVFILHGQREKAGLRFFLDRLQQFFGAQRKDHHRVFQVRFLDREVGARSGVDWVLRLQSELSEKLGQGGRADKLLGLATAKQPFLIVLGQEPLGDLDRAELGGLRDFLRKEIPMLLQGKQYVRVLVPYDYGSAKKSGLADLERAAREGAVPPEGATSGAFLFEPLEEAALPPWSDAQDYLRDVGASEPHIQTLKKTYEKFLSVRTTSYYDLATYLNRKLNA